MKFRFIFISFKIKLRNFVYFIIQTFLMIFPVKKNRIYLESYRGKRFDCNTKYIYKKLVEKRSNKYEIILPLSDISRKIEGARVINFNKRLKRLYYLFTSKYIITNSHLGDVLRKRKECKYILVWHGMGSYKKFGFDVLGECNIPEKLYLEDTLKKDSKVFDYVICSSPNDVAYYCNALNIPEEKFIPCGLPRVEILMDELFINKSRQKIRHLYNVEEDEKIILYAPTFRRNSNSYNIFQELLEYLINKKMTLNFKWFVRLHFNANKNFTNLISEDGRVVDVSTYEDTQELLAATDILITDFSSIFLDYAFLKRPLVFYLKDLREYTKNEGGLYIPYYKYAPAFTATNPSEVLEVIEEIINNYEEYEKELAIKWSDFLQRFSLTFSGSPTEELLFGLLDL